MTAAKEIAKLIPLGMSLNLASDNLKLVKSKKPKKAKDLMEQGMKNIIGTSLIKTTAELTDFDF